MLQRESIEATLNRVRSGELSPEQATRELLASNHEAGPQEARTESLVEMIERLGPPPDDTVDDWCGQMTAMARQHESQQDAPIPEIDLQDCYVADDGRLIWTRFAGSLDVVFDQRSELSLESQSKIAAFESLFRQSATEGKSAVPDFLTSEVLVEDNTIDPPQSEGANSNSATLSQEAESDAEPAKVLSNRFLSLAGGALLCVVAAGYFIYESLTTEPVATAPSSPPAFSSSKSPPVAPQTTGKLSSSPFVELETLETMSESELTSLEESLAEPTSPLAMDDLVAKMDFGLSDSQGFSTSTDSGSLADQEDVSVSDSESEPSRSESNTLDAVTGKESDPEPTESVQPTEISVQLPPADDGETIVRLTDRTFSDFQLSTPISLPIEIRQQPESSWQIFDTRNREPLASLLVDEGGTSIQWSKAAAQSGVAPSLIHARLTDSNGTNLFLRPVMRSSPWPIEIDKSDVMPTWDLRYPLPPKVARIEVAFDLPNDVEEAWIEPIDPESLRRTRGLAVLMPKNGESVSLGVRFDIRCGRKLSCRLRFAGRLDSRMPWQTVSKPLLNQFADGLTRQAMLVSREAQRIENVYDMAGTQGKRIMKMKRDRNDDLAEQIRIASERTAMLESLIATLESDAKIRVRVWVQWPDSTQQSLLEMTDDS